MNVYAGDGMGAKLPRGVNVWLSGGDACARLAFLAIWSWGDVSEPERLLSLCSAAVLRCCAKLGRDAPGELRLEGEG